MFFCCSYCKLMFCMFMDTQIGGMFVDFSDRGSFPTVISYNL